MPKDITITSTDSMHTKDISNVSGSQKVKMIHEQEFEAYGIDPEKVYKDSNVLKPLDPEWIPEIILANINNTNVPRRHQNLNKNERSFVLSFETEELKDRFIKQFNSNLFKTTNDFIRKKGQRPGDYNRILVLETTSDKLSLIIRY